MLLTAKILLTLATLGYSAIPGIFDFNETHATNPSFVGHARFHIVWQVSSYIYIGLLALVLIWTAGSDTRPLWLATLLAAFAYGGFWTAVFTRGLYAGTLVSEVNPVPTFNWNVFGWRFQTDANISLFTPTTIFVGLGALALSQA